MPAAHRLRLSVCSALRVTQSSGDSAESWLSCLLQKAPTALTVILAGLQLLGSAILRLADEQPDTFPGKQGIQRGIVLPS